MKNEAGFAHEECGKDGKCECALRFIREAQYAHGKPDFIAKLQIALKEAHETGYWLELLQRTGYLEPDAYWDLDAMCASLRAMLVASINTAKKNQT